MNILEEYVQDSGLVSIQLGGRAADGLYRIALITVEAVSAADWLAANQAEAQALIDAGQYNETVAGQVKAVEARQLFDNLPDWATWSSQQAAEALRTGILAGMTKVEARAAIDAQIAAAPQNLAGLVTALAQIVKTLSDAVIDGRDLGDQNEAQAIMFLRDIVWHLYRKT